jgi:hypothetical protein
MNWPAEVETFRATHDCEEYAWFVEEEGDNTTYICKGCEREVKA